jgi:hypothetical protein
MTPDRKYRMIRLSAGDYLLPGNDGETLFRIAKYVEDGSLETYGGDTITGEFWAAWYWPRPLVAFRHAYDPMAEWDAWHQIEDKFKTRQDAIAAALTWEWNRDHPLHDQPRRKPVDIGAMYVRKAARFATKGSPDA